MQTIRLAFYCGAGTLTGILLSQVINTRRHRAGHWFCSELCAHAIGLAKPHTLAPGDLLARAAEMNHAFEYGTQNQAGP